MLIKYLHIVVPNIPNGYKLIHSLDSNHAYGAAIIHKSNIKAKKLHQTSSNSIIGIELQTNHIPFLLYSI